MKVAIKLFVQFFLFYILGIFSAISQTWNVKDFTLDDGLTQTQIVCLHQDKKGNIWIGTNGGGVNIYNGKKFSSLTQKNGLISNVVYHISEDSMGNLYFSTKEGFSVYNGLKFKNYSAKDGLPEGFIFCSYVENAQKVWIGCERGIVLLENGQIRRIEALKSLEKNQIWNIHKDKSGNFWFGTLQSGLLKFSKDFKIKKYTVKDSLYDNRIRIIKEFSNGNLLIGTWKGVNIYNSSTGKISKFGQEFPIGSVCITKDDDFWIGRHSGFVTKYRSIKELNHHISEENYRLFYLFKDRIDKILSLMIDKENNLWIGSENGLKMYSQNKGFYNYSESDSLHYNYITAVLQSSKNNFWFGASKSGVITAKIDSTYRFVPLKRYGFYIEKTEKKENHKGRQQNAKGVPKHVRSQKLKDEKQKFDDYICGTSIFHIAKDRKENIWIATNQGVSKFDGSKFYNYSLPEYKSNLYVKYIYPAGLSNERVNYIYEDKNGIIWLGTHNGVTQVIDTAFINFNDRFKIFSKTIVLFINEDNSGNIWFCTDKGAIRFDGKSAKMFNKESGLSIDVLSAVPDNKNNIWFGSKSGVFRFDGKSFTNISDANGLASNNIYLMVLESDTNLFVATNLGLDVIKINRYNENGTIKIDHFSKLEGFIGQECNKNSYFKDHQGRIWFGTVKGVTVYDPKLFKVNNVPPISLITKIQLGYKDLDSTAIAEYASGIDSTTALPKNLVLPYYKNHITIDFVATSLSIPQKVKYKYILEGLNKEWTPPIVKSEADYQGLTDGTYTFKVKACNEDGLWSEELASFTFTINPPFWKTWWFYTLLVIAIVIGVILYIRWRERKLIKEKEVLEATVKERTAEIQQAKEEIEAQRDEIMDKNEVLQQQKEEIEIQKDELAKLSIVASETDNAVIIMDGKGNFEWINEGFTKMYGYTLDQLKMFKGSSIVDVTGNEHLKELIDGGFKSNEPVIYEAPTHTKWGEKIWTQTTLSPIFDENGELVKLVAIDSNINKLKLAEEEIKQQKEEIEAQRDEIVEQKKIVEEKNKDITDSINYAKNIQSAILPSITTIQVNFPETFILFKPRDIVSGDFYWYNENETHAYFAAADCTGHGVPGAFMSMLGFAFLNEIVNKDDIYEPHHILNKLRDQIIRSLHQEGKITDSKDGMDVVLIIIDKKSKMLHFAGANNPLYLIRNNELIEYKGEKMPIAYHLRMDSFTSQPIQLEQGDTIYFFSDGFADQFGGPKGKKFMYKHLKELLVSIQDNTMDEQKAVLNYTIEEWKSYINPDNGNPYSQVDDILIIGVRV